VRAFPARACCENPQGREKDSTAKWAGLTDTVVRSRYRTLDGRRIPREDVPAAVTKPGQAVERAPKAITTINTYTIPLTNTFILLTSGATVTWAHHAILARAKKHTLVALIFTLALAILFTGLQGFEYVNAPFCISDGVYGSCFYMATGFHGFHVFVGTVALFVSFLRVILNHYTNKHHFGFESAIWYWHFVDVVWLFLFINVYWWSSK
jgi:heme/copper-type cytochrome/quinol oxidase subunit 3